MKTRALTIPLILLLIVLPLGINAQNMIGGWDEYLEAQNEVNHFMGSVLVAQKGKILYSKGFGLANAEHDVPNAPQTKFRIGSLTKQFTAAAVLLLQERGLLSVHDPISRHVENAPAAWKDVTVHHLLKHTSGITSFTNFPDYTETWMIPSRPDKTILRFIDKPLDFAPGTEFAYSNSGYILLALVIENVSKMKYEDFLRQNVFDPLGMNDSGHDSFADILELRASGYVWDGEKLEHAPYHDMSIPIGGGDLYSTVEDMCEWDRALYTGHLLSDDSRKVMFTPNKQGYGYGIGIGSMFGRVIHAHAGGINGFASQMIRFPDDDVFFVVLSNQENSPIAQIGRDLAAIFFGKKYEVPQAGR